MVEDVEEAVEYFTPGECSSEATLQGYPLTSAGVVAATVRGDLRVAARTQTGRRLIAKKDLLEFLRRRRARTTLEAVNGDAA